VTGGYRVGTLLDGSLRPFGADPAERAQEPTGRIKLGTESNGGFRNIAISNCVFETSRGLALESVDGGVLEDISIANITMRDLRTAPLFLRLGARLRGPPGTPIGSIRRVLVRGLVCDGPNSDMPSIIGGIPGHMIEDVTISDIDVVHKGGGTAGRAVPDPPEREAEYPEPTMLGRLPAQGFYIRHARNVAITNARVAAMARDGRPGFRLVDVDGADFFRIDLPRRNGAAFMLTDVSRFRVSGSRDVPDTRLRMVVARQI
jgi:polygalacturonase